VQRSRSRNAWKVHTELQRYLSPFAAGDTFITDTPTSAHQATRKSR
jgi:hypothetical protein